MDFSSDDNEEYEKLAFEEEAACLEDVEKSIDEMLNYECQKIAKLDNKLQDWHAIDYDEISRKQVAISDRNRAEKRAEEIELRKAQPYFCHFEACVDDDEVRSFYIGEKSLINSGKTIVLDWRSPLGKTYRNKTQKNFSIQADANKPEHNYDLRLRRMVDIKNAELQTVNTEYDTGGVTLNGEIVDPFLISVLKDKRRNYKLSDIIKTIQES